jgi:predicted amidophosphoribosyltransferase
MADINPIRLNGPWKSGFALDRHVVRSIFIGNNESGYPVFDTERSYIGQLLYELKYRQDNKKVREIVSLAVAFIKSIWKIEKIINLITAIPPSRTYRASQPVYEICKGIGAKLGVKVDLGALSKIDRSESKNMEDEKKREQLEKSITLILSSPVPLRILVVDDLYDTGTTMNTVTKLLRSNENVEEVYALTMTKTKG